jgi:hypothetical protein
MKKCKNCGSEFKPRYKTTEKFCWTTECKTQEALLNLEKIKNKQKAKQRKDLRERKKDLETIQQMAQRVQKVVNQFVRLRDAGKKCISCHKILKGKFDAGHYYNANNHWNVRFNAHLNIFGQCVTCNRHRHGNLIEMRKGLIERIGENTLDHLDSIAHETRKFNKIELQEYINIYKERIQEIKDQKKK